MLVVDLPPERGAFAKQVLGRLLRPLRRAHQASGEEAGKVCGGAQGRLSLTERRSASRSALFSRSRSTLVRPSGVRPTICSLSYAKCSDQICVRGLNRGLSCRVCGSKEVRSLPLWRLQRQQASARL